MTCESMDVPFKGVESGGRAASRKLMQKHATRSAEASIEDTSPSPPNTPPRVGVEVVDRPAAAAEEEEEEDEEELP